MAEIQKVQSSVLSLASRMEKVEKDLSNTNQQVQTPSSSGVSPSANGSHSRKKCTPTALSVSNIAFYLTFALIVGFVLVTELDSNYSQQFG